MSKPDISAGGRERVQQTSKVYREVFKSDPVITYMLAGMGDQNRLAFLEKYFRKLLTAAGMNQAVFHEVEGWQACGVLMPPGQQVDNLLTILQAGFIPLLWTIGFQGVKRMLHDYQAKTDAIKLKSLGSEKKYYYVFFIGTKTDAQGNGYCSSLMRQYQEMASRDIVPIWLEATTEKSMLLYRKLGWSVVDELVLGKGTSNAYGLPSKDGEGVRVWAMVWKPANYQQKASSPNISEELPLIFSSINLS